MEAITETKKENFISSVDELEVEMLKNLESIECPLVHRFTDGLYVREVSVPKNSLITSKIHKTQHQFFLLKGKLTIWSNEGNPITIEAPYIGVTEPNTRRVAYVWEDCIWATCHANPNNEDLEELEDILVEKHENPYIDDQFKSILKNLKS
jgi:hypothetical protein